MKMQTMEMAIFGLMFHELIAAHHAMVRAMEQGQENARHLQHLGSHLAVVGTLHCSVAASGIANSPQGMVAYVQPYKQVILSVLVVFMFTSGFIEIMAGMLVVVNPHPNRRLANIMLWVSHITTVFTVAFLLVRTARASLAL